MDNTSTTSETAHKSGKRPTNVSVNRDLLRAAREFGINLSQLLEQALVAELRRRRAGQWLEENRGAIEEYNVRVVRDGPFGNDMRRF